jgi:hypothetical protein
VAHDQDHHHDHGHSHGPSNLIPLRAAEAEEAYADPGPGSGPPEAVILDIGGDVGALIVYTTEDCIGTEVDLTLVGRPKSHDVHTMIRRRRLVDRDVAAGVYPELVEGRYTVWGERDPLGEVEILGGRVTEFDAGDLTPRS